MNKLIKLLNKYLKYKEDIWPDKLTRVKSVDTTGDIIFELDNWWHWNLWYIISKEFRFIKRLVDNDKIDLWKLIMIKDEEQKAIIDIDNSRENTLLMLLAIQDNPIEFLISILK